MAYNPVKKKPLTEEEEGAPFSCHRDEYLDYLMNVIFFVAVNAI